MLVVTKKIIPTIINAITHVVALDAPRVVIAMAHEEISGHAGVGVWNEKILEMKPYSFNYLLQYPAIKLR